MIQRGWALLGLAAFGCPGPTPGGDDFTARGVLSGAVPTVLSVHWEGAGSGASVSIEWGADTGYGHSAPVGSGDEGDGVFVGLPPGVEVHWRLVNEEGAATADATVTTGDAPASMPRFETTVQGERTGGFALTSTLDSELAYLMLLDDDAAPVWWLGETLTEGAFTDAYPRADGAGIVYQTTDPKLLRDVGEIVEMAWDGSVLQRTRTPLGHHAFVVLPDGTYGYCSIEVRDVEIDGVVTPVVGDVIAEIPPGGDPETEVRVVWNSWDALPMRADPDEDLGFYPFGVDWTHCNGLAYEADTGKYLLSLYGIGSVLQIDAATGTTDWVLGGEDATLTIPGGEPFTAVHSPEPVPGGLRLFNNRAPGAPMHSRVVEYQIDESAATAEPVESLEFGREHYSFVLGDSNGLPEDHILISWGTVGLLTEVDAAREVVWEAELQLGAIVGLTSDVPRPILPVE